MKSKGSTKSSDDLLKVLRPGRVPQPKLIGVELFGVAKRHVDDGVRTSAERCLGANLHDRPCILLSQWQIDVTDVVDV